MKKKFLVSIALAVSSLTIFTPIAFAQTYARPAMNTKVRRVNSNKSWMGKIDMVNATNMTFVIDVNRIGHVTVMVTSSTLLVNKANRPIIFANLASGEKVWVKGKLNLKTRTLVASEVKDFNTPVM